MKKVYFDYGSGWEDVSKFIRDDFSITDRFANSSYHYAQNVANLTMLVGDAPEVPDGSTPYYYMDDWSDDDGWTQTLAETALPTVRGGVYKRDFITISGGYNYVLKLKCSSTGPSVIALVGERADDEFELVTTANLPGGSSVVTFEFTAPDTYTGLGFIWDARVNAEWEWFYIGDGVWASNLDKLKAASEIKVLIQDVTGEITTQLFQGVIAEKPAYKYDGIFENIQIDLEATDRIRKLDVEMGDFVMRNAKIMDYTDKDNSIVHQLAYEAGLTDTYIADVQILTTLSGFAPSSEKANILSEMDKLLYENGYVLHMDQYDKIHPLPWIIASGVNAHIFTETNIVQSISVSENEKEFEGVKVTYNELGEKDNVLLYRDDLPYNSDGTFTGYSIPAGYYYPIEANVIDETTGTNQIVYQEYDDTSIKAMTNKAIVENLDFDARTAMSAFKSDFSAIVATSGHYLEYKIDGGLTPDTAIYSNKKAQVRFNNTAASGVNIYYLNVKGSCLYRTADRYSEVTTVSGTKKINEYSTSYVFDKTTADNLAKYINMEQDYGIFTYKFKSDDAVAVGSLVSIVTDARMNQDVIILEREYENAEDLYTYTCKGYSKTTGNVTKRNVSRTPIKDSFDVVSMGLSSYNLNILSDIDGGNLQLADAYTVCTVLVNGMDYTPDWTYTEVATSGVVGSMTGNVYTISGMSSDSGYVDIEFSKANYTSKTLRCNVSRIRQGVTDYVINTIPQYTPVYLGRVTYSGLNGVSGNTNDRILAYSTTSGECGIYKNISGWQKQYPPTTEMISEAWPDIIYCANNDFPNTGTAQEKIQAYTGEGLTYFEMLAANLAFINSLSAQNIHITISGSIYGGNRYDKDGVVVSSGVDGYWFGAGDNVGLKAYGKTLDFTFCNASGVVVGHLGADNLLMDTDDFNMSLGYECIPYTATGDYNIAFGFQSLKSLTTGTNNVAIGNSALEQNTTGNQNLAIGYEALLENTVGMQNIALGYRALKNNTDANYNIAIGPETLRDNTTGYGNTAIGPQVLAYNTTGYGNVALGQSALYVNTVGIYNTSIGSGALGNNVSGKYNVAVGSHAAGGAAYGDPGDRNIAIGVSSLRFSKGSDNVCIGYESLYVTSTGAYNTAVGNFALRACNSGAFNVAIGYSALYNVYGNWDGNYGSWNTAVGAGALYSCTWAGNNSALGQNAGYSITTGYGNTCLGKSAGYYITTGANNICIGYQAYTPAATSSNTITLGDNNITVLRCQVTSITALSDKRDKALIHDISLGIDFINALSPVEFNWDRRDWYNNKTPDGTKLGKKDYGFIAQDLLALQEKFDAPWLDLVLQENPEKLETTTGKLLPIIVKSLQELYKEVQIIKEKIDA